LLALSLSYLTDYTDFMEPVHVHIPTESWYRCLNCLNLMLAVVDKRTNPHCNNCDNGLYMVKVDPVEEQREIREAYERVTVRLLSMT